MKLPLLALATLLGTSAIASAQAPSAYYLGRVGLFSAPAYTTGTSFTQHSGYKDLIDFGYATGGSLRYAGFDQIEGEDLWATNTVTGITKAIGSLDPLTWRESTILGITELGIIFGQANVYANTGSFPASFAVAAWVADAETGATVRTGLFSSPDYISPSGFGFSQIQGVTQAGLVFGVSTRQSQFGGYNGTATWIMNTDNGITSRVGFFGTDYNSNGLQNSTITGASNLGFISGNSDRFVSNIPFGKTAWVAAGITGGTYVVGLYQPPLYLRPDGYGDSNAVGITDSGYVIGHSARFTGSIDVGRAAWAHNLNNNTPKRFGFTTAEFTDNTTGTQISQSTHVGEDGFIGGFSKRFSGATDLGQAAWVATFTDGISIRAGLVGPEYTKPDGYQYSELTPMYGPNLPQFPLNRLAPQGNAFGTSQRFAGSQPRGLSAWVFRKSTGITTRVGHYTSPEYISADGSTNSFFIPEFFASDNGWAIGISFIYSPTGDPISSTYWAASAHTGVTVPLGLHGPDYTLPNGSKLSSVSGLHHGGYAYGQASKNVAGSPLGFAAWAANLNTTGTTVRIGLFSTPEFVLANGSQRTIIEGTTESGYLWGHSERAEASGGGKVGWVYNLITGTQQTFKIQVAPDGKTNTQIKGVTESGLVWGNFASYDASTSAPLGNKHFVWSPAKGVVVLETQFAAALASNNWTKILDFKLNSHGMLVINGERGIYTAANPGGQGVFRAYFAP